MKKEIVSLHNISVEYDGVQVLRGHNFTVYNNDFIGVIGPNGGGKTTLLKVILGIVSPARGEVQVFGDNPVRARGRIGYVPQIASIDKDFPINVWDMVLMGRLCRKGIFNFYNKVDYQMAEKALKRVEIFHLKGRQVEKLSGGERQRAFIARALVSGPELLLLDEPTGSIDPKMKTGIYDLLGSLKKEMAIILVTHDIGVISSHVDKVACLNCELFYHGTKQLTGDLLAKIYQCPVDLIAHGVPHRVFEKH
jgi:zinc transport system ATP-binding protein